MPRLDLRICGARGLHNTQTFGKIDPYCTVSFEGKQWRTKEAENTTEPEWNEVFKFNVADENSSRLHFVIWDNNMMSDDFLGEYYMSISGLDRGQVEDKWVLLQRCKGNAELHIRLLAVDFGDVPEEERQESAPTQNYRPMPQSYQPPPEQQQFYRPPQPMYGGGAPPPAYGGGAPPPAYGGAPPPAAYGGGAPNGLEQWYGRPVNLRSAHGTHLRAHPGGDGAPVDMQSNPPAEWETFVIEPHRDGVKFRTIHGKFLRGVDTGDVNQADVPQEWETWYPMQTGGGVNFRSFHGKFMRAMEGGEGAPCNQADAPGAWEQWWVIPCQ